MKKCLAVLMALLLLTSSALAADAIATYEMPYGAQVGTIQEMQELDVPEGLEGMYALMQKATLRGDVYLMRMAHGRALASVACAPVQRDFTADELLALWPQIAHNMVEGAVGMESSEDCAQVEVLFGVPMLHIQTTMKADGSQGTVTLIVEGFAFCDGQELTEIWAVHPAPENYPRHGETIKELMLDMRDLDHFIASLSFPASEQSQSGTPGNGYRLDLPQDAQVLTAASSEAEVAAVREQYVARHPEGAGRAFDQLMTNMRDAESTFIFTADMRGVLEIYAERAPHLIGMGNEVFDELSASFVERMQQVYDTVVCRQEDERIRLSGVEHVWKKFLLRADQFALEMDAMVSVSGGWLYEADIYVAEGDQELQAQLLELLEKTLVYTSSVDNVN